MARLLIAAIVLAAAVTLYGLFDCLLRDRGLVRVLPKPVWAIIILVLPVLGFVLWYIFGRGSEDKPSQAPRRRGPTAPDDDEDYLRKVDRDVKLGKHAPEPPKSEDTKPSSSEPSATEADDASGDTGERDSNTDEHGSKGEGRGHSN